MAPVARFPPQREQPRQETAPATRLLLTAWTVASRDGATATITVPIMMRVDFNCTLSVRYVFSKDRVKAIAHEFP